MRKFIFLVFLMVFALGMQAQNLNQSVQRPNLQKQDIIQKRIRAALKNYYINKYKQNKGDKESVSGNVSDFLDQELGRVQVKSGVKSNSAVACNVQDSLALVALYNSTNGDSWTNKTGWLTDSVYKWYGISLDATGRVTGISLSNNNLNGNIPTELGNLTYLWTLVLSRNQLSGSIPTELGNLTNLRYLILSNNQLSGSIPTELGNLTNLQTLDLYSNQLSGSIPTELGNLTALIYLFLSNNQLSGSIPTELGNLTSLSSLSLSNNQLSGSIPTELGNLTNLKYLYLSNNQLSGSIPTELGNLTNLMSLNLSYNQLSGSIPTELGNLTNLMTLNLSNNQLSGSIPTVLGNLTNLLSLILSRNQLSGSIPSELGNLTNLEELILDTNQISGNIPTELGNLSNLDALVLADNQISGNIPTELSNLSSLEILVLADNQISGSIPSVLGNLTGLETLILSKNQLSGSIPSELGNLTNLVWLDLSNNQLSGDQADLSGLVYLSKFYVNDNKLDFGDLDTLNVDWNNLSAYSYSPQDSVAINIDRTQTQLTLSVQVDGQNNKYQWYKDGEAIDGATTASYVIDYSTGQEGEYYCVVTNPDYPDLTLTSHKYSYILYPVTFSVTDGTNPIEGAWVVVNTDSLQSDAEGKAIFKLHDGDYTYRVHKGGYESVSEEFTVNGQSMNIPVVLTYTLQPSMSKSINLYPNPVQDKLVIESKQGPIRRVVVMSLGGRVLYEKKDLGIKAKIDMRGFPQGVYLLRVYGERGVLDSKVVKR